MNTQHKVELDERDANPSRVHPPHPMLAPTPQAMGVPVSVGGPSAGGPPPGAYATAPPQAPPGYPPTAYPPPPTYR